MRINSESIFLVVRNCNLLSGSFPNFVSSLDLFILVTWFVLYLLQVGVEEVALEEVGGAEEAGVSC